MKNLTAFPFMLFLMVACNPAPPTEDKNFSDETIAEPMPPEKLLRHVVLFKFKDEATAEQVRSIEAAFSTLRDSIPEIYDYEWGTNNSPEGLNDGFTHCFFVTFESEKGRDIYLPHPAHKSFVDLLMPHLDKALVVDYWTN